MIRLFVIEDHPVIITGIKNLFRPSRDDIEIVDSANSVDEGLMKADPATFDIFFLDLWLPNAQPQVNVKRLKEKFHGKPIIIFTSDESSTWQRKMFEAGVKAYLNKSASKFEIKSTLEKVMKGQIVFSGTLEADSEKKLAFVLAGESLSLTQNQQEQVILLSKGWSQQQIADEKKISVSTVEKTLKLVRDKCEAKNNTELIRILLEKGVIS
jgi:two-component system vancomycin resistance associated response regulator VraR